MAGQLHQTSLFYGIESELSSPEEILNFALYKNIDLSFLNALCITSACGFNRYSIHYHGIPQTLFLPTNNILEPGLLGILESVFIELEKTELEI